MNECDLRYAKALTETYVIINNLTEDLYVKIPVSLIKTIKEHMDKNYFVSYEDIENNGKMQETIDIMSLIYRDYLCEKNIKENLLNKDEEILNDRYSKMFAKEKIPTDIKEVTDLTVIKVNWYKKILQSLLRIFKKKI